MRVSVYRAIAICPQPVTGPGIECWSRGAFLLGAGGFDTRSSGPKTLSAVMSWDLPDRGLQLPVCSEPRLHPARSRVKWRSLGRVYQGGCRPLISCSPSQVGVWGLLCRFRHSAAHTMAWIRTAQQPFERRGSLEPL